MNLQLFKGFPSPVNWRQPRDLLKINSPAAVFPNFPS
jgi:hypothetical protein